MDAVRIKEVFMKKILITGIVIFFALFMVTCEADLAEGEIEYTDVVYSPDGSQVTVYLDGATVPVTKEQRAMSRELAMMFYDFIEVIFVSTTTARASWELGSPAGISGVNRGGTAGGINYGAVSEACMFVGKKSDKTLLAIGSVTSVEPQGTSITHIGTEARSVTFTLAALETGLQIYDDPAAGATNVDGIYFSSFKFTGASGAYNTDWSNLTATNSTRETLGGIGYPMYSLPKLDSGTATITATYTISSRGTFNNYKPAIRHIISDGPPEIKPVVQKRVPRFMYSGAYLEPKNHIDTSTKVVFGNGYTSLADGAAFNDTIPLEFTVGTRSTGVFSFQFQIPVYMVNQINSGAGFVAGGTDPIRWYIRSGLGSEYYSLDDGASSGGCVLMNVGSAGSTDWLDIYWDWL
jgi:hypothetical protein